MVRADPDADRPRWVVLGTIGAVALAAGVLWPRACGLKFGEEEAPAAASAAPSNEPAAPPEVTAPVPSASATPPPAPESPTLAAIAVGKSTLMHCQDPPAGELKPSKCGDPGLDPQIVPKLEALATCAAIANVTGKLALTIDLDFKKPASKVVAGKGSQTNKNGKRDDKAIEPVLACVRASMKELTETGTAHEHQRYVIAYPVTISAHAGAAAPSASLAPVEKEKPSSGTATVQVDTAIVRDAPSTNGQPIGRLSRGTKVTAVGTSGNWYHVKFGEGDAQEGWIFRTNIGK
ncbi:MAG: SH3 domain-containing protein [Polyangiales bacterium]